MCSVNFPPTVFVNCHKRVYVGLAGVPLQHEEAWEKTESYVMGSYGTVLHWT